MVTKSLGVVGPGNCADNKKTMNRQNCNVRTGKPQQHKPSTFPTPSTFSYSTLRSPPIPRIFPSPGPPCTFIVSGNSLSNAFFHFENPRPSCTLRRANQAPLPSFPPSLYTFMPSGLAFAASLTGFHSFCSDSTSEAGGGVRALEGEISEEEEAVEADRERVSRAVVGGGGMGTESTINWALVKALERKGLRSLVGVSAYSMGPKVLRASCRAAMFATRSLCTSGGVSLKLLSVRAVAYSIWSPVNRQDVLDCIGRVNNDVWLAITQALRSRNIGRWLVVVLTE
jgi:hypothetical protein